MAERKMQITADNEKRRRYYTNLGLISHCNEGFILDFPFLNPEYMQRLYQTIGGKRQRHEKNFGKIILSPTQT